jgi:hypothetical protein
MHTPQTPIHPVREKKRKYKSRNKQCSPVHDEIIIIDKRRIKLPSDEIKIF